MVHLHEMYPLYQNGDAGGRPNIADRLETYSFTDGGGLEKSTLGNRYLKPERSTEQEFGLDLIYRDRITMQLTHARVKTTDQLTAVPLPSAFGFTSQRSEERRVGKQCRS